MPVEKIVEGPVKKIVVVPMEKIIGVLAEYHIDTELFNSI